MSYAFQEQHHLHSSINLLNATLQILACRLFCPLSSSQSPSCFLKVMTGTISKHCHWIFPVITYYSFKNVDMNVYVLEHFILISFFHKHFA